MQIFFYHRLQKSYRRIIFLRLITNFTMYYILLDREDSKNNLSSKVTAIFLFWQIYNISIFFPLLLKSLAKISPLEATIYIYIHSGCGISPFRFSISALESQSKIFLLVPKLDFFRQAKIKFCQVNSNNICANFTHLSRYVGMPVHPFPSTCDIQQSIPHDLAYFLKMDTVHGYFQLALSVESSDLTTFLLQQGKFKYLRAPIGPNV